MRRLSTADTPRERVLAALVRPALEELEVDPSVLNRTAQIFGQALTPLEAVQRIVADVRRGGDAALLEYARRIDGMDVPAERLYVSPAEIDRAAAGADPEVLAAIRRARDNIRAFHERQRRTDWFCAGEGGSLLGQRFVPVERAACYVPGGRAPLVSTALMAVVPAAVAGVEDIVLVTPGGAGGAVNPYLLVAAREAGAHRILRAGGAQAVAALAYGTETVDSVDKIVGPGNVFVQLAKKLVFGRVGIDTLAGPSEILVIADETASPAHVAADLLAQAEHDPDAAAWLLTTSPELAAAVHGEVERQLADLPKRDTARASLERWGLVVVCTDLAEAVELANLAAPEHLELVVREPLALLSAIRHAGAVFLGPYATEPVGDYIAGPNHILPTNGAARFGSQLGVDDFLRRSSVIAYTRRGVAQVAADVERLAAIEGLEAHARAVRSRTAPEGPGPRLTTKPT